MGCVVCGKGMTTGHSLFRINPKGQPGIWACAEHIKNTDVKIDPEVLRIAGILDPRVKKP